MLTQTVESVESKSFRQAEVTGHNFIFKRVTTEEELEAVYKLRYQVYVVERGFESALDHPDGMEKDEYDAHSVHFLALTSTDDVVGTARLVLHSELGFPIEKYCKPTLDLSRIPRDSLSEISRLAITKRFLRRAEDGHYGSCDEVDYIRASNRWNTRRIPSIVFGLFKVMYKESKWLGLTNWYCAMEESLNLLLQKYCLCFYQIGNEVQYHGLRTPYIARIGNFESTMAKRRPDYFYFFTDWGRIPDCRI